MQGVATRRTRSGLLVLGLVVAVAALTVALGSPAHAATFTVNSVGDGGMPTRAMPPATPTATRSTVLSAP